MSQLLKFLLLLQIILTLTGEVCAKEALPSPPPLHPTASKKSKDAIHISADHIIQGAEKESVFAWGRVKIQYQDRILRADKVMVNNVTGIGKAAGHVIMTTKDGTQMKAQSTTFDMKSEAAKLFKVRGTEAKKFFFTGKEVRRLSKNHFRLRQTSLTTCEGVLPDWEIEAGFADVIKGDRALFTNATFKIRDIPLLYIPIGYIPIDQERKTGLLPPTIGWSKQDGALFTESFFWAINQWSDTTFYIDQSTRGTQPGIEYRYTPTKNMSGTIRGSFLKDKATDENLWKIDMNHQQSLPHKFKFKGTLDLESRDSLNQATADNPGLQSRRSTDSFANITRSWDDSTLDILTRFRESTSGNGDKTFGELPNITYKVLRREIGKGPFSFNLDTSFASFVTDLNESQSEDQIFKTRRFDLHPELTLPLAPAPWLSITPTVGAQWTHYSRGLDPDSPESNPSFTSGFFREKFDIRTVFKGPKFDQIFKKKGSSTKVKHLIQPSFTHTIADNDEDDHRKIKAFDAVDKGSSQNSLRYGITQRFLKKENKESPAREILRFGVTQTFDIREATVDKSNSPGYTRKPFSALRFDLDSRPLDSLILNFDTTYDHATDLVDTFNFEAGIKPVDNFWIIMERRWIRNESNFILGTLDLSLKPGWRMQYSTHYDELTSSFRENVFSLLYDNPCKCWGASFDIVDRNFQSDDNLRRDQFKVLWNITFRGLGAIGATKEERKKLLHRDFEDPLFPNANSRR